MSVNHALSESAFQKQLAFGQMAETLIAKWLIARGRMILPVYDVEFNTGKGPRVFGARFEAAAPDLVVFRGNGKFTWCEAKHKTVFTWYRIGQRWTTGIDLNHWEHYRRVAQETGIAVYMFFLHRCSVPDAKDRQYESCPPACPTGLFGGTLGELSEAISHTSDKHGRHGMVYWAHESLQRLDSLENVLQGCRIDHAKTTSTSTK